MNDFRTWLRRKGLGRLAYRYVHRPWEQLDLARQYGWHLAWAARRGDREMRAAARKLSPSAGASTRFSPPIAFLTGRNFVHQAIFCAHSFAHFSGMVCTFEFLSDGSLSADDAADLRRLFPGAVVRSLPESTALVAAALPPAAFPALHAGRREFVMLRKLTDSMAGQRGYRLLLDSDMLFWAEPRELLARAGGGQPLYLADTSEDGYTMNRAEILQALGRPAAKGVNAGLVGLDAGRIEWDLLEKACARLWNAPGDRRLLEQTLWAIALAAENGTPLERESYRLVIDPPGWAEARGQATPPTLLHYAWHARLPYAATEWRRYLREAAA